MTIYRFINISIHTERDGSREDTWGGQPLPHVALLLAVIHLEHSHRIGLLLSEIVQDVVLIQVALPHQYTLALTEVLFTHNYKMKVCLRH